MLFRSQCVPDASGGNCPVDTVACPQSESPSVCVAQSYADQDLPPKRAIKGWGLNACIAAVHLAEAACRLNLNPKALKKIICTDDPAGGECPPLPVSCTEKARKATCRARKYEGKVLAEPLEVTGDSGCEAKQELARQACKRSLRPSAIDEIVCEFEK